MATSARYLCEMEFFTALGISAYLQSKNDGGKDEAPAVRKGSANHRFWNFQTHRLVSDAVKWNSPALTAYVWSYPSGWKQGSQPKSGGPLGATILPWKTKSEQRIKTALVHRRGTPAGLLPQSALWKDAQVDLCQHRRQRCREPTPIYLQTLRGVCTNLTNAAQAVWFGSFPFRCLKIQTSVRITVWLQFVQKPFAVKTKQGTMGFNNYLLSFYFYSEQKWHPVKNKENSTVHPLFKVNARRDTYTKINLN